MLIQRLGITLVFLLAKNGSYLQLFEILTVNLVLHINSFINLRSPETLWEGSNGGTAGLKRLTNGLPWLPLSLESRVRVRVT